MFVFFDSYDNTPTSQPSSYAQSLSYSNPLFKPLGGDIGWKWNGLADKNSRKIVKCDFCKTVTIARVSRVKQHQLGIKRNVVACSPTQK